MSEAPDNDEEAPEGYNEQEDAAVSGDSSDGLEEAE